MTRGTEPWNIVLVEDHDPDVFLIKEALSTHEIDCQITHFRDGEEAVKRLCNDSSDVPDAILLDLNMPRLPGIEVLKAIRNTEKLKSVPVAILTSSQSPVDRREAAEAGATVYISKQPVLEEFLDSVGATVSQLLTKPVPEPVAE